LCTGKDTTRRKIAGSQPLTLTAQPKSNSFTDETLKNFTKETSVRDDYKLGYVRNDVKLRRESQNDSRKDKATYLQETV